MLQQLSTWALAVLSGVLLVGTPADTIAGHVDVAVEPAAADSLEGKCYLAIAPRFFEMDFGENKSFDASLCTTRGTYSVGQEFIVFSFWNASCAVNSEPVSFNGFAIASAVLFFRVEGASFNSNGLAFRTPCGVLP